jgi:hypothetical protein
MRTLLRMLLALAIGLIIGSVASAQELVKNPTGVRFTPMDYEIVTSFEGGYFAIAVRGDGTCDATTIPAEPLQREDLGKPGLRPDGDVEQLLHSRPAIGCFVYKVLAKAGVFVSPWSEASAPFQLVPLQQGRPVIR